MILNCSLPESQHSTTSKAACKPLLSQQNELAHCCCWGDLSKVLKGVLSKLTRRPQLKKIKREFFWSDVEGMAKILKICLKCCKWYFRGSLGCICGEGFSSSSPSYVCVFFFQIWAMILGKSGWESVNEWLRSKRRLEEWSLDLHGDIWDDALAAVSAIKNFTTEFVMTCIYSLKAEAQLPTAGILFQTLQRYSSSFRKRSEWG